jgi:hypothetical protein
MNEPTVVDDDECVRPVSVPTPTGFVRYGMSDPRKIGTPATEALCTRKEPRSRKCLVHPAYLLWASNPFPADCQPHNWMGGGADDRCTN